MINPLPPIHSDFTIVMEDSCNCACYPCRQRNKSPDKDDSQHESNKVHRIASSTLFDRIRNYLSGK